ncbi:hypothetical protein BBUCA8_02147 [Borreliella burgdorferi CA8]|nr:hypothetical protein BBUCA8_02147 [Borreliella burgdorferi CA8]
MSIFLKAESFISIFYTTMQKIILNKPRKAYFNIQNSINNSL